MEKMGQDPTGEILSDPGANADSMQKLLDNAKEAAAEVRALIKLRHELAALDAAEQKPNIYQRMLKIMEEVHTVEKTLAKPGGAPFDSISHDSVTKALHHPCVKWGVYVQTTVDTWQQDGNRTEILAGVKFINSDKPEEYISVNAVGFGVHNKDFGPGMALSYALKTALLKAFLLQAGEPDIETTSEQFLPSGDARAAGGGAPPSTPPPVLSDWSGDEICRFGKKWSGHKWRDVEDAYLEWIINNVDKSPGTVAAAKAEVQRREEEFTAQHQQEAPVSAVEDVLKARELVEPDHVKDGPQDEEDDLPF